MQRPDAERLRPVKLMGLLCTEGIAPDASLRPVKVDRTRPVEKICLGELTGNDRTLGASASDQFYRCVRSGQVTVGIRTRGRLRATGR